MRLTHQTYIVTDPRTGRKIVRQTKTWYVEFTDANGVVRRKSTGLRDKKLAEQVGARLERDAERVRAGVASAEELAGASLAFTEAVKEYVAHLRDRHRSEDHRELVAYRLSAVGAGCGWKHVADMNGGRAQRYLRERMDEGEIAAQTQCHYVATLRAFAGWLVRSGKLARDPFVSLERAAPQTDRRHRRRALSGFSFLRLLISTRRDTSRRPYGFTGEDRAALYLLAAFTGLRASELASLDRFELKLDGDPPAVRIAADESKNRREAIIPLPRKVAARFREWLESRTGRLWPGRWADSRYGARFLKRDLQAAGIPYEVAGRVFDFHALRGQYATMLARAGVPLQMAQKLMRHSDPRLTASYYTHLELRDLADAADLLTGKLTGDESESGGETRGKPKGKGKEKPPQKRGKTSGGRGI